MLALERRPLGSICFRAPRGRDLGWGLTFGVMLLAGAGLLDGVVFPALHLNLNIATYRSIISASLAYRVAIVTRASVCEEVLFRMVRFVHSGSGNNSSRAASPPYCARHPATGACRVTTRSW